MVGQEYKSAIVEFKDLLGRTIREDVDIEYRENDEVLNQIGLYLDENSGESENVVFAKISTNLKNISYKSDPRVQTLKEALSVLTDIYLIGDYDGQKPTLLFIQGASRGITNTFGSLFERFYQDYNIAFFAFNHEDSLDHNAEQLSLKWKVFKDEHDIEDDQFGIVPYSYGTKVFRQAVLFHNLEDLYKNATVTEIAPSLGGSDTAAYFHSQGSIAMLTYPHLETWVSVQNPYGEGEKIQEALFGEEPDRRFRESVRSILSIVVNRDENAPPETNEHDSEGLKRWKERYQRGLGDNYVKLNVGDPDATFHGYRPHYQVVTDSKMMDIVQIVMGGFNTEAARYDERGFWDRYVSRTDGRALNDVRLEDPIFLDAVESQVSRISGPADMLTLGEAPKIIDLERFLDGGHNILILKLWQHLYHYSY